MRKYLCMFVLVMLMVKTNAQDAFYYYKAQRVELKSDNDRLLIKVTDPAPNTSSNILQKIATDQNFDVIVNGAGGYFLLQRKTGSGISKEEAVSSYMSDPAVVSASFMYEDAQGFLRGTSDNIAVQLKQGITIQMVNAFATELGISSYTQHRLHSDVYYLTFSKSATANILNIAASLFENGNVKFAEPVFFNSGYVNSLSSASCNYTNPSDPLFQSQWGLYNPGGLLPTYGINAVANEDINICNAWNTKDFEGTVHTVNGKDINTGNRTRIAVIDQGVDMDHPDLNANVTIGYQTIPSTGWPGAPASPPFNGQPGAPSHANHHGTQCAGIMVAEHDGSGMAGIAYMAELVPIRSFYHHVITNTHFYYDAWVADGIDIAAMDAAVDVISCSWSTPHNSLIDLAIDNAADNGRNGKGCIVVFSCGNENKSNINYPSSHPKVISVGASTMCAERKRSYHDQAVINTDPQSLAAGVLADPDSMSCDEEWWWGSNYGLGIGYGAEGGYYQSNYLSVVAPGVKIYTTLTGGMSGSGVYFPGGHTSDFNGTSAAAPHVAGVAALMLSVNPCLTRTDVKHIIQQTAEKIPGPAANPYGWTGSFLFPGDPDGTWVNQVGYGRLNAGNAVTRAHDMYRQNEIVNYTQVYTSYNKIFAGEQVDPTGTIPVGVYEIQPGSDITYEAPKGVTLAPGFAVQSGAFFTARIISPACSNGIHYKRSPEEPKTHSVRPGISTIAQSLNGIKIYPNPATDQLSISLALAANSIVNFTVVNMLGQKMIAGVEKDLQAGDHVQLLNIASLQPGMYMLVAKVGDEQYQMRFVKK